MRTILFSMFLCCSSFLVWGQTVELYSMHNLEKQISKDQLIVFDIDNTIYHSNQDYGSDEWFFHQMTTYKKNGLSNQEAFKKVYDEYFLAQALTDVHLVEKYTCELISHLQNSGYNVMALTTRSLNLLYPTNRHLTSLGIDISKTAPTKQELYFNNPLGVLFHGGILFTNGTDKGAAFNTFCDLVGYKPEKVVFINDKQSDLVQVERGCDNRKIPFLGFRYGYLDNQVKSFTGTLSEIQKSQIKGLLSNEEAKKHLN